MSEVDRYDFPMPQELIAQQPLATRSDARLLVVDRRRDLLTHAHVRDLGDFLREGDCLVLNNSRVIPARLIGYRVETGGRWQGLFLSVDPTGAWQIVCKARGRLAPGERIMLIDRHAKDDTAIRMLMPLDDGRWAVRPESEEAAMAVLERVGRVPLPHYIRRGEMLPSDWEGYQTVYATHPGSIAAPTAGLHLTKRLLQQLRASGISTCQLTLHVGLGTFRPIATERLEDHGMHAEWGQIDEAAVARLVETRAAGGRIVAVGSTSVRLLETAAAEEALLQPWSGETNLFIRPPFKFRVVDAMLTNFHLPKSTLIVLVRTFGGDPLIRRAYTEAIEQQYRFFSYGDAMLIL